MKRTVLIVAGVLMFGACVANEADKSNEATPPVEIGEPLVIERPTTTTEAPSYGYTLKRDKNRNGWSTADYNEAKAGFFAGYGSVDDFGECVFDYIIDHNDADDLRRAEARGSDGMEFLTDAVPVCEQYIN